MDDALKAALIVAFRKSGLTKVELAARLGQPESRVREVLDPRRITRTDWVCEALAALGLRVVVAMEEATPG